MTDYLQEADTAKNQEDFLNRIAKAANRPRHTLGEDPFVPDLKRPSIIIMESTNAPTLIISTVS